MTFWLEIGTFRGDSLLKAGLFLEKFGFLDNYRRQTSLVCVDSFRYDPRHFAFDFGARTSTEKVNQVDNDGDTAIGNLNSPNARDALQLTKAKSGVLGAIGESDMYADFV